MLTPSWRSLVRRLKVLQGEARHSLGTSPTSLFIRVASRTPQGQTVPRASRFHHLISLE